MNITKAVKTIEGTVSVLNRAQRLGFVVCLLGGFIALLSMAFRMITSLPGWFLISMSIVSMLLIAVGSFRVFKNRDNDR